MERFGRETGSPRNSEGGRALGSHTHPWFARSMPSAEVVIEMKTARHRNPSMTWDTNTIFDIDAMALSVPYCDAVVTERHAYSILHRAGLGERMGTALIEAPNELVDWLAGILP